MRYIIGMVLFLMAGTQSFSQNFEVGPYVGGANYIGDVGNSTYLRPNNGVFGALFKWNQSTRHSYRASLMYATISGDDRESRDTRRRERGYSFTNTIMELSLGLEFNWYEYDPYESEQQSTPYIYTGINYYLTDHIRLTGEPGAEVLTNEGNNWEFSIPMVVGYKLTLLPWMSGGVELGARYAFTDNLDGSKPSEIEGEYRDYDFGNRNTTDWYIFTGIYLTFNFGSKPCYTHF